MTWILPDAEGKIIVSALKTARNTLVKDMESWLPGHMTSSGALSAEGKEAARPFRRAIKKLDAAIEVLK